MTAYHVSRNGTRLGVYPESDAVDYFSQGRIGPEDMVWREGMVAWVPARDVFGPTATAAGREALCAEPSLAPSSPSVPPPLPPPRPPPPPPAPPPPTAPAQPPASLPPPAAAPTATPTVLPAAAPAVALTGPRPPRMHWALVLALTLVTFGLFFIVWMFIQSIWVRRIDPTSNATGLLSIYVGLVLTGQILVESGGAGSGGAVMGTLLVLAGTVVSIFGFFSMRRSMLQHFNQARPDSLKLSAALTLFLNVFYFQYHLTRIAERDAGGDAPRR